MPPSSNSQPSAEALDSVVAPGAGTGPTAFLGCWTGREDALGRIAQQLYMLLTGLRAVGPELASWVAFDEVKGEDVPVTAAEVCRRALEAGACPWKSGAVERTAYETRLYLERSSSPYHLTLTAGIEPFTTLGVYAPNRLRLCVPSADRTVCERVLRAVAAALRPDWAAAGGLGELALPTAIFGTGEPEVGWLTYVSGAYGDPPARLPERALALPVGSQGTLYAAHAALYHRGTPEQKEAIRGLRDTLRGAGLLLDAAALAARGRGAGA